MTQEQYNEAINLIGHLILTASTALTELLALYGVNFERVPTKTELIDATIEMLEDDSSDFTQSLTILVDQHIDIELGFGSPDTEDAFFGGLIKGAIGAIGGLLKKKKRRNNSNGGGNNGSSSQNLQAEQIRRDLEKKIDSLIQQQRIVADNHRRELKEKEEQAKQARRRTHMIFGVVGAVVIVTLIGMIAFKMNMPKPHLKYTPQ